jgi:hypothetical protein
MKFDLIEYLDGQPCIYDINRTRVPLLEYPSVVSQG